VKEEDIRAICEGTAEGKALQAKLQPLQTYNEARLVLSAGAKKVLSDDSTFNCSKGVRCYAASPNWKVPLGTAVELVFRALKVSLLSGLPWELPSDFVQGSLTTSSCGGVAWAHPPCPNPPGFVTARDCHDWLHAVPVPAPEYERYAWSSRHASHKSGGVTWTGSFLE
jgi:hypothetical protein